MELFMVFIFGIFAQLLLLSSAGKLDSGLPKGKPQSGSGLFAKIKNYFLAYEQKTKKTYFAFGLALQTVCYLFILVSIVFYVLSVFTDVASLDTASALVSYILIISGTLAFVVLLFYFIIKESKNGAPKSKE